MNPSSASASNSRFLEDVADPLPPPAALRLRREGVAAAAVIVMMGANGKSTVGKMAEQQKGEIGSDPKMTSTPKNHK